ncbi:MAG: right-handed parallel beta-helix repeat-containing protein [Planctomycetales bacterium]|nr:right-handed parallel beta-helix repeat-containing protein [Planctomycetales bacterium]
MFRTTAILGVVAIAALPTCASAHEVLSLVDFLPALYATDGSVSYQHEIQRAVDAAAEERRPLLIPPLVYRVDETGIQLRSGTMLSMYGAQFLLDERRRRDGAVFVADGVTDVTLNGGEIAGRNDAWPDGVNIRGIHVRGASARIRIRDVWIHDLSSNGVGVFGSEDSPVRDVTISDAVIENCCNRYPDYLSSETWEEGSTREDQGLVACYYVDDFTVRGCRLEGSRSDGTHFYHCRRGQIIGNRIYRAKMGGYFLESCDEVIGTANIMRENGSRGTTIERGSRNCVFTGNTVAQSGREGLWAPDCVGMVVTSNVFELNGRKPNGAEPHQVWNANVTINQARHDPSDSPTADYLVADNIIRTSDAQVAAIRVDAGEDTSGIVIRGNVLRGENRTILVSGPRRGDVTTAANDAAILTATPPTTAAQDPASDEQ